jgi:hypothetical protein
MDLEKTDQLTRLGYKQLLFDKQTDETEKDDEASQKCIDNMFWCCIQYHLRWHYWFFFFFFHSQPKRIERVCASREGSFPFSLCGEAVLSCRRLGWKERPF